MRLNLFDFVAAHSQQTAEFIKGGLERRISRAIRLRLPAALATSLVVDSLPLLCKSLPAMRRHQRLVEPEPDRFSTGSSFPPRLQSTDGKQIFCLLRDSVSI